MKSRALGKTGYTVTAIGFGAWGVGGDMWRGSDDSSGREALRAAVDQGITFVDTALAYGDGHSEQLIGATLKSELRSGKVTVATKIPAKNYVWPGAATSRIREVFPADYVATATEASLKRLGVDAIPVQQFHVWHDAWLKDPEWPATRDRLERLKKEGKVLHWGISINDHAPETALQVLADPIFETAQVIYNIYDRSPEKALFDLARKKPLGIIARVPFDEGALTGAIKADTKFPAGDWRESYFAGDRRAEAERHSNALAALLNEEVKTLPELALRFCLSAPAVSTVIAGMRRATHVRDNIAAGEKGPLSAQVLAQLAPHAWEKNWY